MPEGAECRIIAEGLDAVLRGKRILGLQVISGRYQRHGRPKHWDDFHELLPRQCISVGVKGKFIHIDLEGGFSIWNTLGMSGTWCNDKSKHARVSLLHDGGELFFDDPRNFGTLRLCLDQGELIAKLKSLGLDFLNGEVTPEQVVAVMAKRRNVQRTLAEVVMDQSNFAGVGNYVKAEALFRAHLSPHRTASSLAKDDINLLHKSVLDVLLGAYRAHGLTISDYEDLEGRKGTFELQVYGRKSDPEGNQVITEETLDKRTTHWVPAVQR